MPQPDNPAEIHKEAYARYVNGDYMAARLLWARGREAARVLGDKAAMFSAGTWEAGARRIAGDMKGALRLLFELLSDVPAEATDYAHWNARRECFVIQLSVWPELEILHRLLADLQSLAGRIPHPAADLPYLEARIFYYRGRWEESLRGNAQGWHLHDGAGFTKSGCPNVAICCCLRLGRRKEAGDWIQHLGESGRDNAWGLRDIRQSAARAALFDGNLEALANCRFEPSETSGVGARVELRLRDAATDSIHDPADPLHPARKLTFYRREQEVHDRYDRLLTLVDYRLACLRFTAALPAVDDLYYHPPEALRSRLVPADPVKFQKQLRSFDFSWHLLMRLAKRLDGLMQCDWRTREAEERARRCAAIVAVCKLPKPKTPKTKKRSRKG